jgi:hypothetical protein
MKVRDVTWREPVTIEVDETVAHAAHRLAHGAAFDSRIDASVSTAGQLADLVGVFSTQIMFPHAREEPPVPAVVDA